MVCTANRGPRGRGRARAQAPGLTSRQVPVTEHVWNRGFSDDLGIVCEEPFSMLTPTETSPQPLEVGEDLRPRARTLSWMASLAVAGGDMKTAEGYLLELLSICVFAERVVDQHSD